MKILIAILLSLAIADTAEAQLFRRFRQSQMQSSGNHWTYPGDLASHLQGAHGVSVGGLTREQMLNLHDALHEGRKVPGRRQAVQAAPVFVAPPVQIRTQTVRIPWL